MWLSRETDRGAGSRPTTTKARPHFFVEMASTQVTIDTQGQDPKEWLSELHQAICRMQMLVFERRDLDLGEDDVFALYVLSRLQSQIVK